MVVGSTWELADNENAANAWGSWDQEFTVELLVRVYQV